jgi:hypothetical protein
MIVNFSFDYVIQLHNKDAYISAIEKDEYAEEVAFKKSLVIVKRDDIKSMYKTPNGEAFIVFNGTRPSMTTVEGYDEIVDTIQKANTALDIMYKEKIYFFDGFEVDSDELNIIEGYNERE